VEAYTGQLLMPPEIVMIRVLKAIAKSKGPFVIGAQYGFTGSRSFPYICQADRDNEHPQRLFAPFHYAYSLVLGDYDFRETLRRRLARALNLRRHSSLLGITNTQVYRYQVERYPVSCVLITEDQHLYLLETTDAENE
jgi:hypothetical protein